MPHIFMYEIFKTSIAQMGAVGLLLAFAGIVIYWLKEDLKVKDLAIKQEIEKRESLLREVLTSHQDSLGAIRSTFESINTSIEGIRDDIDELRHIRKDQ